MIESYKDLHVWQRAIESSLLVYAMTAKLPKDDLYGIGRQMRRSAVSIASHIAKGYGRSIINGLMGKL